jgi:hypothetical protein
VVPIGLGMGDRDLALAIRKEGAVQDKGEKVWRFAYGEMVLPRLEDRSSLSRADEEALWRKRPPVPAFYLLLLTDRPLSASRNYLH